MRRLSLLLTVLLTLPSSLWAEPPSDWNQWRGPTRDGRSDGAPWPTTLKGLTPLWRVPLGPGYPGPIVSKDRVFVAETRDKKFEVVRALDRATGKQIWEHSWEGSMKVIFIAASNGDWIRSTPALDGDTLYLAGMRDVLVAIDAVSGKERWRVDFVEKMKSELPPFGFVSSPLIDGGFVYVQAGGCVACLEKGSGKLVWTALKEGGAAYNSAFSSPILATIAGAKQLVVQTRTRLAGLDLVSGEVLWSQEVPAFKNMNILTPLSLGDRIFTSTYGGKSFLFEVQSKGGKWTVAPVGDNKQQGYMSSPVVLGDHIYLHLKSTCFGCFDRKTGREKWVTSERFGKYWSMATRGDKMLALDERGILYLIKANPERFELLDERKVSDASAWGHLAVHGPDLFVRELNAVAAYRLK